MLPELCCFVIDWHDSIVLIVELYFIIVVLICIQHLFKFCGGFSSPHLFFHLFLLFYSLRQQSEVSGNMFCVCTNASASSADQQLNVSMGGGDITLHYIVGQDNMVQVLEMPRLILDF